MNSSLSLSQFANTTETSWFPRVGLPLPLFVLALEHSMSTCSFPDSTRISRSDCGHSNEPVDSSLLSSPSTYSIVIRFKSLYVTISERRSSASWFPATKFALGLELEVRSIAIAMEVGTGRTVNRTGWIACAANCFRRSSFSSAVRVVLDGRVVVLLLLLEFVRISSTQ